MHVVLVEIYQVLDQFQKAKNKKERIEVLTKNSTPALKDVLRGTFDDRLVFLMPDGTPPYTPNDPKSYPSSLHKKHKDFGYFCKGGPNKGIQKFKLENMFIALLESLHPQDAEIVLSMVNKKSPVKYLTKKLIEETFPTLISS